MVHRRGLGRSTGTDGQAVWFGLKDAQPWQPAAPGVSPNVVWGTLCAGADCALPWNAGVVFGMSETEGDTVVWGTSGTEGDTVVWGTSCTDPSCEPILWSR